MVQQPNGNAFRFRNMILLLILAGTAVLLMSPAAAETGVTISAQGDHSYYLGEEVILTGTNYDSDFTYLFITGPGISPDGGKLTAPLRNVVSGDPGSFDKVQTQPDKTWEFPFYSYNLGINPGPYVIYAVSQPKTAGQLTRTDTKSVSVIFKKPFITAEIKPSDVIKGQPFTVAGYAEGNPGAVQLWIVGDNYVFNTAVPTGPNQSYVFTSTSQILEKIPKGQSYLIVQHPMQNNQFDIYPSSNLNTLAASNTPDTTTGVLYVINKQATMQTGTTLLTGQKLFNLLGAGNLQGSDAADALVQGINSPNVDDTYTKLQFLVENPTITINPIGDRHVGDKFTITSTTNLAVDDDVLCQVYSSSFKPTDKSQSGEFSGATGTVKVTKGTGGLNKISFDVDASTFKPDEYIVQASGVLQSATGTAVFNVLEGAAPTAVPTVVVTTAAPTAVVTTVPPTTVATPTKTPTQPGFGALVALIGLGAVALLVVRRH